MKIVETESGSVTSIKQFIWCQNERCEERSISDTVSGQYFTEGEAIVGTSYFFSRDHIGSVREMLDSTGNIQAQYAFSPYGKVSAIVAQQKSSFSYAAYYMNQRSGLYLTEFRTYNSKLGTWLSRDPVEQPGISFYSYASGDPIIMVDPRGRKPSSSSGKTFSDAIAKLKCLCERCLSDPKEIAICKQEAASIGNALQQTWTNNFDSNWYANLGACTGGLRCFSCANRFRSAVNSTNPTMWEPQNQTAGPFGNDLVQAHTYTQVAIKNPDPKSKGCKFWVDSGFINGKLIHFGKAPIPESFGFPWTVIPNPSPFFEE